LREQSYRYKRFAFEDGKSHRRSFQNLAFEVGASYDAGCFI
jgi:hypothetical protein